MKKAATKKATNNYLEAIRVIKSAILKSRYRAASLANKELLSLYYGIGKYISENSREGFWGKRAVETISEKLQQELPGLRGFSAGNIKKMRIFFEQWFEYIEKRALLSNDLGLSVNQDVEIRALTTHELKKLPIGFLSALDDLVRLPHENPSIGIILCKNKNQRIVEYAFRDMTKPMGVATYKTAKKLPPEYRNVLPDAERLKELL